MGDKAIKTRFLIIFLSFLVSFSYCFAASPSFITITSPSDGSYISKSVTIEAQLNQIPKAKSVKFYIDSKLVGENATSPYQYSWDTTSYPDGTHEIYASMLQAPERPPQIPKHPGPFAEGSLPILDSPKINLTVDNTPPEGIISVNNYAVHTNSVEVTLTLSATDNLSGVDKMKFSNDGSNWSDPEDYATSKTWTLTGGDGTKTIYVRFKDIAGNWSGPVNDVIILDTTPAVGITLPQDNSIITENEFTIKGIARGTNQIYVNNKAVSVNLDGTFTGPTLVAPGYAKRQNITSSDRNYIIMNYPGETTITASGGEEEDAVTFHYYQLLVKLSTSGEITTTYIDDDGVEIEIVWPVDYTEMYNFDSLEDSPFSGWLDPNCYTRYFGYRSIGFVSKPPGYTYQSSNNVAFSKTAFYRVGNYSFLPAMDLYWGLGISGGGDGRGWTNTSITLHTPPASIKQFIIVLSYCHFLENEVYNGPPLVLSNYRINGYPLKLLYHRYDQSGIPLDTTYAIVDNYQPDKDLEFEIETPYYPGGLSTGGGIATKYFECTGIDVLRVEMTAYRPQTMPFNWWAYKIPDDDEENLDAGAGIRINGDDDNHDDIADRYYSDNPVTGEDDLIMVTLEVAAVPAPQGLEYVLKRSNSNINVWESPTKATAILDVNDEEVITFDKENQKNIWVENPYGGSAFLEFEVRTAQDQTVVLKDRIYFYSFTSAVIALGGENQIPTDPPDDDHGTFRIARDLYMNGYDVHMFDEDELRGNVRAEARSAIEERSVNQIAIFGYSHGGGSTYILADYLNNNRGSIGTFTISYTAYIDAVENVFPYVGAETRRPSSTSYLTNYYQEGVLNPVSPDFDGGLAGGPVYGADYEVNVDDPTPTETHFTIDDDPIVLNGIKSRLRSRVTK